VKQVVVLKPDTREQSVERLAANNERDACLDCLIVDLGELHDRDIE
jgi:hypothetical protein